MRLPGTWITVGAAGEEASSALVTFLQMSPCFCFQAPQQGALYIRSCIRVHQVYWVRLGASFHKLWDQRQVSVTLSHHHLPVLLRASPSASRCRWIGACMGVIAIPCECGKKSLFLIYPEDKSQCALQAVPTWKRVSVTSREAPFPGDMSSSWGYNRRQNLRLLGTSFGCNFF